MAHALDGGIASWFHLERHWPASFDNNMKRRLIPVLAPESLASMPTKRLLGRLLSLQQCEESAVLSDRTPGEAAAGEGIVFKNTAEWRKAYADLKEVLATREHVPSAAERAKARQQRSTRKSNKRAGGGGRSSSLVHAGRARPAPPQHGR
jgi:hypothetical protein